MTGIWTILLIFLTSISLVSIFLPNALPFNSQVSYIIRFWSGAWVFWLTILGLFVIIFHISGMHMQPDDKHKPKYEQVQEPIYRLIDTSKK